MVFALTLVLFVINKEIYIEKTTDVSKCYSKSIFEGDVDDMELIDFGDITDNEIDESIIVVPEVVLEVVLEFAKILVEAFPPY